MALSDLAVYSEYAYSAKTEVLRQQIDLFNAASGGCIALSTAQNSGDFSETAFWQKISGLVKRRNAYGSGAISTKVMKHIKDRSVKVAAGTAQIQLDPGQFKWIQRSPKEAGAALGIQLAKDTMADMLNIALGCTVSAIGQIGALTKDVTSSSAAADKLLTFGNLNRAQSLFGDRSNEIGAWVTHSKPLFDLYGANLANSERLFTYESVNVIRDPFGKLIVVTDSDKLYTTVTGTPDVTTYHVLGLTPAVIVLEENNDFDAVFEDKTGDENLQRFYQAEWSYQLGIKGFAWDIGNGGKSPNDTALLLSTNWDKYATDNKDMAGVLLEVL